MTIAPSSLTVVEGSAAAHISSRSSRIAGKRREGHRCAGNIGRAGSTDSLRAAYAEFFRWASDPRGTKIAIYAPIHPAAVSVLQGRAGQKAAFE
jgi:hypothetical protein